MLKRKLLVKYALGDKDSLSVFSIISSCFSSGFSVSSSSPSSFASSSPSSLPSSSVVFSSSPTVVSSFNYEKEKISTIQSILQKNHTMGKACTVKPVIELLKGEANLVKSMLTCQKWASHSNPLTNDLSH